MTNEELSKYYNETLDKGQCWVSKNYPCPLREHCTGLIKPECKEHIDVEEALQAVDEMLAWYTTLEEPRFVEFYSSHIAGIKKQRDRLVVPTSICADV